MKSLYLLKKEAKKSTGFRGHTMGTFWKINETRWESFCEVCSAWVMVDTNPAPNGIEIGGPAVAVGCTKGSVFHV